MAAKEPAAHAKGEVGRPTRLATGRVWDVRFRSYTGIERAEFAYRSACKEYGDGVRGLTDLATGAPLSDGQNLAGPYGDGSWEVDGRGGASANRGWFVNRYLELGDRLGADGEDTPWCGHFQGFNYYEAGVSEDLMRAFWSADDLKNLFEGGEPELWVRLSRPPRDVDRTTWVRESVAAAAPRRGDIVLLRGNEQTGHFHHVGIVGRFDAAAAVLYCIEGNKDDRVRGISYDLHDDVQADRLSGIGRLARDLFDRDPAKRLLDGVFSEATYPAPPYTAWVPTGSSH